MAKNQIAKKTPDYDKGSVEWNWADGNLQTISVTQFPENIRNAFAVYGMSQKLGDEYAGAEGPEEAREAMNSLLESLLAGTWSMRRTGGGTTRTTMLAEALSRVTGQDVDTCQEKIAAMDDETVKSLRGHKQVKAALEAIKLERQQAKLEKAEAEAAAGGGSDLGAIFG